MTLAIQSATGRLTEEQQRLVTDHIQAADHAANWMVKPYRSRGMTYDDARSDAMAWLVLCAMRFDPAKKVKFLTFYLGNVKWWRLDIMTGKLCVTRNDMRTMQMSQMAHRDTHEERQDWIDVADDQPEPIDTLITNEEIDFAQSHAISLVLAFCRRPELMIDRINGMNNRAIARKYRLSHQRISQIIQEEKQLLRAVFADMGMGS